MALVRVQDIQRNAARARMAPKPTGRINSNGLSLRKPIQTAPPPSIAPRGPLIDLTLDVASSNEDQFVAGQCPTTFERDRLTRLRLMRSRESRASNSSEEWPDTAAPDSVLTVQDSPLLSIRNPSEEMVTTPQPIQSAIQSQIGKCKILCTPR